MITKNRIRICCTILYKILSLTVFSDSTVASDLIPKNARIRNTFLKYHNHNEWNGGGTTTLKDEGRELSYLTFSKYVSISGDSYYGRFGNKVSLSSDGNRLAVSSRTKDVYYDASIQVFEFNGDKEDPSWIMIGNEIQMEGAVDSADIHVELDEDGDTMITGFSYNVGMLNYAVMARVFQLRNGRWEQVGADFKSNNSRGFPSDISVSISASGTKIVVAFSVGSEVNVLDLINDEWVLDGQISGKFPDEQLGAALALSSDGTTMVIGAPKFSSKTMDEVGCARVYRYRENEWIQLGTSIVGEAAKDRSGSSLDISANGNIVMIGAMFNDAGRGQVRVYEYDETVDNWNQLGQNIDGESGEVMNERVGDYSGKSITMSADGMMIAIGAPNNRKYEDYYYTGHVRIFAFQDQQWVQVLNDIDGSSDGDTLGYSVSMSGSGHQMAIGAPGNADMNTRAGQVRVYEADVPLTRSPSDSPTHAPTKSPSTRPSNSPTLPILEPQTIQITYTLGFKSGLDTVPYNSTTLKDGNVNADVMDALKNAIFSALTPYIISDTDTSSVPTYDRDLSSEFYFKITSPFTSIAHKSILDLPSCPRDFIGSDSCVQVTTEITVILNVIKYDTDEVEASLIKVLDRSMSSLAFVDSLNEPDVTRIAFGDSYEIPPKDGIGTITIVLIASSISVVGTGVILYVVHKTRSHTKSKDTKQMSSKKKESKSYKANPPFSQVSGRTTNFTSNFAKNQSTDPHSTKSRPKLRLPDIGDDVSDDGGSYDVSYIIPSESRRSVPENGNKSFRPFSAADSVSSAVSYVSALVLPLKKKLRSIEEQYSSGHQAREGMNGRDSGSNMTLSTYFRLDRSPKGNRELHFRFNDVESINDESSENNKNSPTRLS